MRNVFAGVDGVLFDLDGTLVETNIDFALMKREVVAFAERHGIPASRVQGLDILAVVDSVVRESELSSGADEAYRIRREAFEVLEQIELEPCSNAHAVPHAIEVLQALGAAQIKVGIVTRNCRRGAACSMERTGIHAEVLLTRDDVQNTKPHPDHLLQALGLLGLDPDHAIMIGDHWMDVKGGQAAGMRTIGFLRENRPADFFDSLQPDLVIHSLGELLPLIERLKL